RAQGYAFEKNLEATGDDLTQRWRSIKLNTQNQTRLLANQLNAALPPVEAQLNRLVAASRNVSAARGLVGSVRSHIDQLESRVSAAENTIRGMYDAYDKELTVFTDHLKDLEFSFAQLAGSCLEVLPSECLVRAVKACWLVDGREDNGDPDGFLFLTDQRLIFEQNEEVATKKILFVTTERKKVQEVKFTVPVALVEEVTGVKQGLFKNEDHLKLTFAHGAPFAAAHLHLFDQDCSAWQGLVRQVKAGELDRNRAVAVDQEAVEMVRSAPTECPACGGKIDQVVLRGMTTLTCSYCGSVIRL
ncbi:MAG TPA: hypothetical protein VFF68_14495, partial [Anaerolineaceae bacterium]|nr:hypothetical protein [Anaerolineaceae bacterium]